MPMPATVLLYSIIFLYGIIIGCFLNICFLKFLESRFLAKESHCMGCGHWLHWYGLFPLLS